jgi:transposase
MWTSKNRGRYDRSRLRYPSDLTDEEGALVEPLIPPASGLVREVMQVDPFDGAIYVFGAKRAA